MTGSILALRISRRAMGAAVLTGGLLTFVDGRHLTTSRRSAAESALRYAARLIDICRPRVVVLDAPVQSGSPTADIVRQLVERWRHLAVHPVPVAGLLSAYGVPALETRNDLRDAARRLFPDVAARTSSVTPFVLDASAAALFAECQLNLGGLPR